MSIPLPLQERYTLPLAQEALRTGFAAALSPLANLSAISLAPFLQVDQQGFIRPTQLYLDGLVPSNVQPVVTSWFGVDAWQTIQRFTNTSVNQDPAFVPSPEVLALYQATQTPLPAITQQQLPPELQLPAIVAPVPTTPITTPTDAVPPAVLTVLPQLPAASFPSPLSLPALTPSTARVTTIQPVTQFAEWWRQQIAVALQEIIEHLAPVLPPIFEEQLQLTAAEQDVLRVAAAITEPVVTGIEAITDLVRPAQELIDAGILTPLQQAEARLADVSANVREMVVDALGAAGAAIDEGRTVAVSPIAATLDAVRDSLAEVAGLLEAALVNRMAEAQESIASAMAQMVSDDTTLTTWFQSLIPKPENFMADVLSAIRQCDIPITASLEAAVTQGVAAGVQANVGDTHSPHFADLFNGLIGTCVNLKSYAMGSAAIGALVDIVGGVATGGLGLLGGLFNMLQANGLASAAMLAAFAPAIELTQNDAYEHCPIKIASLPNAATARRLGLIGPQEYDAIVRKNGYDAVQAAIETANQVALPSVGDTITAAIRSAGRADAARNDVLAPAMASLQAIRQRAEAARPGLKLQGYRDEDIDTILDNAPLIPPVSDLIMFDKHDVFDETVSSEFQLFDEFPENLLPLTRMQGIPDEFVKYYHASSWTTPSNTQLFQMYHRLTDEPLSADSEAVYADGKLLGYRLIGARSIDAVFRANDVLKKFREPFLRVSDQPLTRVDTRRAFVMGAVDEQQVLKSYIEQGYSPENAAILLRFNKVEKERTLLSEVGEQRKAVATAFANAYEKGTVDESAYSFALTDLGYDPQTASVAVARSRLERELKYTDAVISALRKRFVKGKISQQEAGQKLLEFGLSNDVVSRLLNVWCYEVGCEDGETVQEREKDVTKAEILSFYDDGLIGQVAATERIAALGYSDTDAEMIVANAQIKRLRANIKAAIKAIHDNVLSNTIDILTASSELDGLGVPTETRDLLLNQWRQEREQSELRRAREVFLAPGDHTAEANAILDLLGLPPEERERLSVLWGSQKAAIDALTTSVNGIASNGLASTVS